LGIAQPPGVAGILKAVDRFLVEARCPRELLLNQRGIAEDEEGERAMPTLGNAA
jgi:hypothetical protein